MLNAIGRKSQLTIRRQVDGGADCAAVLVVEVNVVHRAEFGRGTGFHIQSTLVPECTAAGVRHDGAICQADGCTGFHDDAAIAIQGQRGILPDVQVAIDSGYTYFVVITTAIGCVGSIAQDVQITADGGGAGRGLDMRAIEVHRAGTICITDVTGKGVDSALEVQCGIICQGDGVQREVLSRQLQVHAFLQLNAGRGQIISGGGQLGIVGEDDLITSEVGQLICIAGIRVHAPVGRGEVPVALCAACPVNVAERHIVDNQHGCTIRDGE